MPPAPVQQKRRFRQAALLGLALVVGAGAGCGNACRDLADKICSCAFDDNARALCTSQARQAESNVSISRQDQQACQDKLKTCDCTTLQTPAGRANCGLSYP